MLNDLISIIIPVKNGSNYLAEALAGIKKQNMNNIEIVVVDDASADNTAEIAQKYACKVIRSAQAIGQVAAKNLGIKHAQGKFIMFHDHDDIMNIGALAVLWEAFTPEIQIVSAKCQDFISPELAEAEQKKLKPRELPYGGLLTGAYLFRQNVFDLVGCFNEKLRTGEAVDFLMRCAAREIKEKKLDFVATQRRLHNTNIGRLLPKQENKDYAALLRAKLTKKI